MTNYVKKGANRKSAMAKKSRHAQRTPLPPKDSKPTKTRTQSLKDAAAKLDMIRASGQDKAKEFASWAKDQGWWTKVAYDKDSDITTVTAKRDDGEFKETIMAEWHGSRVPARGVTLSIEGGRTIVLRNVSAARQHMDGSKMVKREVTERRAKKPARSSRIITVNDDGTITHSETVEREIIGAHVVDKWYDMTVTRPVTVTRKGKKVRTTKVIAKVEGIGKPQVESLTRLWEGDGFTVAVTDRAAS